MLPATYQMPAAIVLLLGGVVACFFGYRLFRIVLAIFGFIIGALAANADDLSTIAACIWTPSANPAL